MPNNELQELLSTRFDGYSHSHSTNESVWSGIESQLDAEKSDRAGIWFWIFNGITAAFFVGLLFQSSLSTDRVSSSPQSQTSKGKGTAKQEVKEEINREQTISQSELAEEKVSVFNKYTENKSRTINLDQIGTLELDRLRNTSKAANSTQATNGESTQLLLTDKNQEIAHLETKALTKSLDQVKILNILPRSTNGSKRSSFRRLPIHLGVEFTYLRRSRPKTNLLTVVDTGYEFVNNQLRNNRNFEFNLLTQFDFTKRFSASVGIGYSSSNFDVKTSQPSSLSSAYSGSVASVQRILTIPIQSKFAFFQQNRFSLSAGLTFQGEFGGNVYLETVKLAPPPPPIVTGTPVALAAGSIIATKQQIQQFAIEPFVQLSIGISPRLSIFANLGYRRYFNQSESKNISPNKLDFMNADFGINFQIH